MTEEEERLALLVRLRMSGASEYTMSIWVNPERKLSLLRTRVRMQENVTSIRNPNETSHET